MIIPDLSRIVNKLLNVLLEEQVQSISALLEVYGQLGYQLGLSIEGLSPEVPPSIECLRKLYLEDEHVGAALMLQGLLVKSWIQSLPLAKK